MAWFGYDQGVFSGVLISSDFKKWFPETEDADISGITSSSFAVRVPSFGLGRTEVCADPNIIDSSEPSSEPSSPLPSVIG